MRATLKFIAWLSLCGRALAAGVIPAPGLPANGGITASPFSITAGAGNLTLNTRGTSVGTVGGAVTTSGPQLDGTAIRYALTGGSYTVSPGVSLVRFTQTNAITSQIVVLPAAIGDTHPIEFDNYVGAVNAYSFSPPVQGWTNGSAFPASVSVRIRWDANDNTWHRIG